LTGRLLMKYRTSVVSFPSRMHDQTDTAGQK